MIEARSLSQVLDANGMTHRPIQDEADAKIHGRLLEDGLAFADIPTGGGKSILATALSSYVGSGNLVLAASTRTQVHQLVDVTGPMLVKAGVGNKVLRGLGRSNYICMDRARKAGIEIDPSRLLLVAHHQDYLDAQQILSVRSDDERGCGRGADGCQVDGYNMMMEEVAEGGSIVVFTHASLILGTLRFPKSSLRVNDEDALFIDEGHNLADSIGNHMGAEVSVRRFSRLEDDLRHWKVQGLPRKRLAQQWQDVLTRVGPPSQKIKDAGPMWRVLPEVEEIADALRDIELDSPRLRRERKEQIGLRKRINRLVEDLTVFAVADPPRPTARWVSADQTRAHARRVIVDEEANRLFGAAAATLVVSATLLPEVPRLGVQESEVITVGSPFDLRSNRVAFMPPPIADQRDTQNWIRRNHELIRLVEAAGGRALILTPAMRQVPIAAMMLREAGIGPVAEQQGTENLPELVERLRAGEIKALVGSRSLWEGVDIPGPALSLVVLLAWPNPVPSDPVIRVQREKMTDSQWWPHYHRLAAVPAAQALGRLIRTETDMGMFALLDARAPTQSKAAGIVAPSPVITDLDEACAWLSNLRNGEDVVALDGGEIHA